MMEFLNWWRSLSNDFAFGVGVLIFFGFLGLVHLIEVIIKAATRKSS